MGNSFTIKTPAWIDLSSWDSGINFRALYPKPWIIVSRATLGESFIDPEFLNFYFQTKINGIRAGSFHFLKPGDIGNQADLYLETIRNAQYQAGDILCLDWEDPANTPIQALQWLIHVERESGIRPIIYSSREIVKAALKGAPPPSWFSDYFWWPAGYPNDPDLFQSIPTFYIPPGVPAEKIAGWQYSEDCRYPGCISDTDINWISPAWAQSINLKPPTDGNNMNKFSVTPEYQDGNRVRRDHSTKSEIVGFLPFGKYAFGDGDPFELPGEIWHPVTEVNGASIIGWIATTYNHDPKAVVTQINNPPTDPSAPIPMKLTIEPQGYESQVVNIILTPKS